MGVVEELASRVPVAAVAVGVVISYILYKVYQNVDQERRMRRLGVRAPLAPTKLPFGEASLRSA